MHGGVDEDWLRAHARDGKSRLACPACGPTRKDKRSRTLTVIRDVSGIGWMCWHCQAKGMIRSEGSRPVSKPKKDPVVVPLKALDTKPLDFEAIAYLQERGISLEIAELCGVVSGQKYFRRAGGERAAIGFTYRAKGQEYAAKWRCIEEKDFTQDGSAQTLYLADKIASGQHLIITEGEMDALSFWQAGLPFACSIPSGAIQSSSDDDSARLRWLALHEDLLRDARSVFLAVDADGPGQTTAKELARRIGKARCWTVTYPEGCKDANDVLVKHGAPALEEVIKNASPWPVEGLAGPSDFAERVLRLYRDGLPRGLSTGWPAVDEIYSLNAGNLVIVTGVPGHGKSSWIDALLVNAMQQHDWRIAYASFENPPEIHTSKLLALKMGKPFGDGPNPRMSESEMRDGLEWIGDRVTYLTHDGVQPTTQSLIERFETAVMRSGVKACVVDPFNFLKLGQRREGGVDTEAINEMLSEFKLFAQRAEVVLFLVAHPAKPVGQNADWVPNGYSISGSAHFYNRADFGLTMHRKDKENVLHVWKARFAHQGQVGQAPLIYDRATGGFKDKVDADNAPELDLDFESGFDDAEPF